MIDKPMNEPNRHRRKTGRKAENLFSSEPAHRGKSVLRLRGADQDRGGGHRIRQHYFGQIKLALGFILLACIFDLFDGRVARMGGVESPFGREFDSLADLISFGVAPAFLVQRVVLHDVFVGNTTKSAGSSPRFICFAERSGWRGSIACPR